MSGTASGPYFTQRELEEISAAVAAMRAEGRLGFLNGPPTTITEAVMRERHEAEMDYRRNCVDWITANPYRARQVELVLADCRRKEAPGVAQEHS